jgi:hypothetical protein
VNITEANAFNVLADWILSGSNWANQPVTDDEAKEALTKLAEKSFKSLSAGVLFHTTHAYFELEDAIEAYRAVSQSGHEARIYDQQECVVVPVEPQDG